MLKIKDLNYAYSDGHKAINHVSLSIIEGERVALVGANGAGKSTLYKLIMGIVPIESGLIEMDGVIVEKKNFREIRKKIGMVFQNPDDQLFMTKVYDDVAFGPRNEGLAEDMVENHVNEALKSLNILELKNRMPQKLSGGEKRRVAIATVLSMHPKLILLDEPTSFLDPTARRKVIEALRHLRFTQLIATHDLDMALEICNRVIVMRNGEIFADGKTKEILLNKDLMEVSRLELPLSYQRCNSCELKN
ncbi:MAG: energy-coupling factor ABC transporter ATP-binding protein [Eubacteriaceae bacterium]